MRHFGLSQTRMRVRSNVNKVESYIKRRRQKLLLKESATLPWQGILCLVFGLVFFLLVILLGQFFEEEPRKQGGPGSRRSYNKSNSSSYRNVSSRRTSSRSGSQYQRKKYWRRNFIKVTCVENKGPGRWSIVFCNGFVNKYVA